MFYENIEFQFMYCFIFSDLIELFDKFINFIKKNFKLSMLLLFEIYVKDKYCIWKCI